ncbi:MND1-interacting protein 1 [Sesamum alatum]|uniref:MND1-interacting protein 1 n=1 Tax=Sesamum alatum TaxID=300844 RepID=A0AAE2C9W5_9LAMI|nr:MND1-interacting protein 1 [Sesamum alatum]
MVKQWLLQTSDSYGYNLGSALIIILFPLFWRHHVVLQVGARKDFGKCGQKLRHRRLAPGKVVAMAGSRGGKHSKSKGKSKSKKSDVINKKPEAFSSNLDLAEISNKNPDGSKDSSVKNPQPNVSSSSTTNRSKYTEDELEEFLYAKIEVLYNEARDWLLKSGYSLLEVERAFLNAGYIHGPVDLLNNILTNSIAFIEKTFEPKREAFNEMDELYESVHETLVDSVMQMHPGIQRSDAIWHLLIRNWGHVPSTTITSHLQGGNRNINSMLVHGSCGSSSHSKNEDAVVLGSSSVSKKVTSESDIGSSLKKVGILERINLTPAFASHFRQDVLFLIAAVQKEIGAPQQAVPSATEKPIEISDILSPEFLTSITDGTYEACSDDPRTAAIADLLKEIRDLLEEVKGQKEWAHRKVIDSAKRLSKDSLELKMLRMEKVDKEKGKNDKIHAEKSCVARLMETEQSLRKVNLEVSFMAESVRRLETKNSQFRADIQALKLNASESDREMKEVLTRERRCMKKLADFGKQTSIFRSQCEEEKQRLLQLELELLQVEKEAEEAEMQWKQEIKEREHMVAVLAEETRKLQIHKAESRIQLLKLRKKVEIDSRLARDDRKRLEDELSRLRISSQKLPDMLLEDDSFWCTSIEATGSSSSAPCESSQETSRHWNCMLCLQNDVSVVFLPCTHQVICFPCYEINFKNSGWPVSILSGKN